jgi:hypothetical protein
MAAGRLRLMAVCSGVRRRTVAEWWAACFGLGMAADGGVVWGKGDFFSERVCG